MTAQPPVRFRELATAGGGRIGIATLDAPATLNALSLEMVDRLSAKLAQWAADPGIAMVMLDAEGRAFCAGGDLQGIYRAMNEHEGDGVHPGIAAFFAREYGMDYAIHAYPKPVLAWGHGIAMGGGMGLLIGASHRVVTEASRLAMPEIVIGLFPDVGMSWALNRMPAGSGRFLALTGAPLHAADAVFAGWADYCLKQEDKPRVLAMLVEQPWRADRRENDVLLHGVLDGYADRDLGHGPLRRNLDLVAGFCASPSLDDAVSAILQYEGDEHWLRTARDTLAGGAPSTARIAWELQYRARRMSLAEVLRLEYRAALWCCARGDLREGIRALLIDKDKNPAWKQVHGTEVDPEWADGVFKEMEAFPLPSALLD